MPIIKTKTGSERTDESGLEERNVKRDYDGLVVQLGSDTSSARGWAAKDLAEYPESVTALLAQLAKENSESVREAIFNSLAHLGGSEAVSGLLDCLRSEDVALRNSAIEALRSMPDDVAPVLKNALDDGDPDVRIFVVNVLDSLRYPFIEELLIGVIESDEHVNVCATAVDILVEVGTASSLAALNKLKDRFPNEPYIQFAADLALKRISAA